MNIIALKNIFESFNLKSKTVFVFISRLRVPAMRRADYCCSTFRNGNFNY